MVEKPVEPPERDDEGRLIDRVEKVVDEFLGEDLTPPTAEDPWERRAKKLEAWTAVVLGLAAVATAWATFQASQWSEEQAQTQFTAATLRTDAGRAAAEGTSERIIDSELWLNWLAAIAEGRNAEAKFFQDRFSPELDVAQKEWLALSPLATINDPSSAADGTPLDLESYRPPSQLRSIALADEAEALVGQAAEANSIATRFILVAAIFSLTLFFAGIATKFTSPRVQAGLLMIGIATLVLATIRMFVLPQLFW